MSKKMIVRYVIENDNYVSHSFIAKGRKVIGTSHKFGFCFAKSKKRALVIARKIGPGTTITQISKTRSGKTKLKSWVYSP